CYRDWSSDVCSSDLFPNLGDFERGLHPLSRRGSHLGGDGSQCLRSLDAELLADLRLDLSGELRVFLQEVAGVVLTLTDAVLLVLVPGAGFVDHAAADAELEDLALEGHPF